MGAKKNKNDGENTNNNNGGGGKKDHAILTVVLKVNLHCEGCATKIKKSVKGFEGVENVKGGYDDLNKLTVIGKVDPEKLREMVEQKVKKKVELVSPAPKKDKDNSNKENSKKEKDNGGGGAEKKTGDNKPEKKPDDKKSKEPPVTSAVMKVDLHCQGCIKKIRKTVTKTKGYIEMSIDEQKNLIALKGSMDMKALAKLLSEKLKKPVEIVPPKKEGEKKEKEKGGGGGKGNGGGDTGAVASTGDGGDGPADENRIQYVQYGYPNPAVYGYGMGYPIQQLHAPQIFSDENPNACSIM